LSVDVGYFLEGEPNKTPGSILNLITCKTTSDCYETTGLEGSGLNLIANGNDVSNLFTFSNGILIFSGLSLYLNSGKKIKKKQIKSINASSISSCEEDRDLKS
jgi:hypothetical protein